MPLLQMPRTTIGGRDCESKIGPIVLFGHSVKANLDSLTPTQSRGVLTGNNYKVGQGCKWIALAKFTTSNPDQIEAVTHHYYEKSNYTRTHCAVNKFW
jgi:hypothetical protein